MTVVLALAMLVGFPLVSLIRGSLDQGLPFVGQTLARPELGTALWHTLALALTVTAAALLVGTALTVVFDRALVSRPSAWRWALALPLLVPQFTLTLSWTQAYGPGGWLDHLAGVTLPNLYGAAGIALLLTVDAIPVAWLVLSAGLSVRREPDLVRAAYSSGASAWTALRTVDLPLMKAPLLAAAAVVFVGVVNSFAVPQVLGAARGYQTLATLAYQQLSLAVGPAQFARLCVVAVLMVLLVLAAVSAADRGLGRLTSSTVRAGSPGAAFVHTSSTGTRIVGAVLTAYVVLTTVAPLLALAATSVTRAPGLVASPQNWTGANYAAGLSGPGVAALGRTVALAVAAASVVTLLSAVVVGLGGSTRNRLGTAVTLGFAVPGTALAIAVLVTYGGWLGGSVMIILVAYLGKSWALGYRALAAGVDRMPPELGQAARASGAGPVTVLRSITAPTLYAALVTCFGLVALFALHELTMSSILYGANTTTFAVVVLNEQQLGDVGASAALAIVLTLPMVLVAALAGALLQLRRSRLAGEAA